MSVLSLQETKRPIPITTDEFDRKVEAGEDIDDHIDWSSMVLVQPGELSPGEKLSLQQASIDKNDVANELPSLSVLLPLWALERLGRVAESQGISREDLAQLLIVQQMGQSKVPA